MSQDTFNPSRSDSVLAMTPGLATATRSALELSEDAIKVSPALRMVQMRDTEELLDILYGTGLSSPDQFKFSQCLTAFIGGEEINAAMFDGYWKAALLKLGLLPKHDQAGEAELYLIVNTITPKFLPIVDELFSTDAMEAVRYYRTSMNSKHGDVNKRFMDFTDYRKAYEKAFQRVRADDVVLEEEGIRIGEVFTPFKKTT
jgi:hypothetical protein